MLYVVIEYRMYLTKVFGYREEQNNTRGTFIINEEFMC